MQPIGPEVMFLHSPGIHVCFALQLGGQFSREEIGQAVRAVERRHPVLGSAVQLDGMGRWCFAPGVSAVAVEFPHDMAWQDWYNRADGIPFDLAHGPLLKIAVFRGETQTDIVFLGHHILGDGLGYMNLTRDFLAALDGTLADENMALPEGNTLQPPVPVKIRLTAALLNRLWRRRPKTFTDEEYRALFQSYRSQNPTGLLLAEQSEEWLQGLRRRCQAAGLTVNEAIAQALVEALQQQNGGAPVRLGCALSLRQQMKLPVGDKMGNFVSGVAVIAESPEEVPAKLREKLQSDAPIRNIQTVYLLDSALVAAMPFVAYGDFSNKAVQELADGAQEGFKYRSPGISNLGAQPLGPFSFDVRQLWFIPPAFPRNNLTLGVISCAGGIRFCLRYLEDTFTQAQIEEIYEAMTVALEA